MKTLLNADYEDQCGVSGAASASELSHSDADKHITELELPELIACCKESNCNAVNYICIDEGLPIVDKILIQNLNDSSFSMCFSTLL